MSENLPDDVLSETNALLRELIETQTLPEFDPSKDVTAQTLAGAVRKTGKAITDKWAAVRLSDLERSGELRSHWVIRNQRRVKAYYKP